MHAQLLAAMAGNHHASQRSGGTPLQLAQAEGAAALLCSRMCA